MITAFTGTFSARYESPCGVMSPTVSRHTQRRVMLRIPMRGYELPKRESAKATGTRYESPCGVMSLIRLPSQSSGAGLRIPMRGYELSIILGFLFGGRVTNPHAGL